MEAQGFVGGLWCLWKPNCPPISVLSTSKYCIHLQVTPNLPSSWFFTIVYASPNHMQREDVWKELEDWSHIVTGPWCLVGDFNQVLFAREKQGGAPFNHAASASFAACLNACNLVDRGFKGQLFTWQRGSLRERLDWGCVSFGLARTVSGLFCHPSSASIFRPLWFMDQDVEW